MAIAALKEKILLPRLREQWKEKLKYLGFYAGLWVYLELMLHLVIFKGISLRIIYPIFFALIAGSIYHLLTCWLPEKASRIAAVLLTAGTVLYFEVQLVYHCIFHSFLPVSQMVMGADAVTNFSMQVLHGILTHFHLVLLIFLPVPALILLFFKKWIRPLPVNRSQFCASALCLLLLSLLTSGLLHLFDQSEHSAYDILISPDSSTETCIRNVGVAASFIQEARAVFFPQEDALEFEKTTINQANSDPSTDANVTIALEKLEKGTASGDQKALNSYLKKLEPTEKHQYTGLTEGYNLITITAEGFSPYLIDKERTPALYQLSTNGFIFKNFYCSFPNTTTNGEYAHCTGLMPNMSRNKKAASFEDSKENTLPYTLANAFKQIGVESYAYHNYYGTFYNRNVTHKNMGYQFKAIGSGLEMEVNWPSSDLEMIQASAAEYLSSGKPFHAYYMTFSGHYQYNWDNAMSAKNKAITENLDYSEPVKAYIACNMELEYALQELMTQLEEAGVADKTVIVLTADHYPYGLSEEEYNELAGKEVDTSYERFQSSFICYVPGMEPVTVEEYCSTVDILPTLLNLFGLEYDSRLLAGRDILAPNGTHIAVLADQSYMTDTFRYDSATACAYTYDGEIYEGEEVEDYCRYVQNMFTLSNGILRCDYYAYIEQYATG